jgi:hypothetical protein
MTMKLQIPSEVQAGLLAQARRCGMSLEAFAESVLSEQSRTGPTSPRLAHELSSNERLQEFNAWVKSHAGSTVVLADEAMERESIYGDHGR